MQRDAASFLLSPSPPLHLSPLFLSSFIHPSQSRMRFFSSALLSATMAALVLSTDAQTEVQPRVHPLSTLTVGPHPDSIEGRSLIEKRAYGCSDPGYPIVCGNYCCMWGCNLAGTGCGCSLGYYECSSGGGCCMTGWTCSGTNECTKKGGIGGSSSGKSSGNTLVSSGPMGLLAAVAAVVVAA